MGGRLVASPRPPRLGFPESLIGANVKRPGALGRQGTPEMLRVRHHTTTPVGLINLTQRPWPVRPITASRAASHARGGGIPRADCRQSARPFASGLDSAIAIDREAEPDGSVCPGPA